MPAHGVYMHNNTTNSIEVGPSITTYYEADRTLLRTTTTHYTILLLRVLPLTYTQYSHSLFTAGSQSLLAESSINNYCLYIIARDACAPMMILLLLLCMHAHTCFSPSPPNVSGRGSRAILVVWPRHVCSSAGNMSVYIPRNTYVCMYMSMMVMWPNETWMMR